MIVKDLIKELLKHDENLVVHLTGVQNEFLEGFKEVKQVIKIDTESFSSKPVKVNFLLIK